MENVARPPPGLGASASAWAPFDIKGIRLYPHESRYSREFSGGLHVPAHLYGALESNLARDIALLTRRGPTPLTPPPTPPHPFPPYPPHCPPLPPPPTPPNQRRGLVDYSFLVSVFPAGAPRRLRDMKRETTEREERET